MGNDRWIAWTDQRSLLFAPCIFSSSDASETFTPGADEAGERQFPKAAIMREAVRQRRRANYPPQIEKYATIGGYCRPSEKPQTPPDRGSLFYRPEEFIVALPLYSLEQLSVCVRYHVPAL